MKIRLLVVGKTDQDFVEAGLNEFRNRLKQAVSFEMEVIPDLKNRKSLSFEQQKEKEGESILKSIQAGDYIVLLDERGKEFSSLQFAEYIERKTHTVTKRLVFVVGGPYGFSQKVQAAAHEKIALSQMTFSHQFIRLIFIEQLYRAITILNNQPYHHE
ncbi:MAG: 23S rRNA (pseudouridine(1915)-N(3))-methyltransferase RlmH [Dysgonamonadaceae bacterium]|jgi:23S rRNA (pseudouridine1915-N3)-methyltransferase|nr:23S rRNA (pseudouridine(1915)-N(3))-methyltransferase RlmH [Dysgonamonadaceae bacterium]